VAVLGGVFARGAENRPAARQFVDWLRAEIGRER
jgi:hypothetical protein